MSWVEPFTCVTSSSSGHNTTVTISYLFQVQHHYLSCNYVEIFLYRSNWTRSPDTPHTKSAWVHPTPNPCARRSRISRPTSLRGSAPAASRLWWTEDTHILQTVRTAIPNASTCNLALGGAQFHCCMTFYWLRILKSLKKCSMFSQKATIWAEK